MRNSLKMFQWDAGEQVDGLIGVIYDDYDGSRFSVAVDEGALPIEVPND